MKSLHYTKGFEATEDEIEKLLPELREKYAGKDMTDDELREIARVNILCSKRDPMYRSKPKMNIKLRPTLPREMTD
jgi:hypothetical protein